MSNAPSPASPQGAAPAPASPTGAKLRSLTIKKFRNVRPTTLRFDDEWNVLLGKNGTGKTTLLDLIAATCRGDIKALAAMDPEVEIEAQLDLAGVQMVWSAEQGPKAGITGPDWPSASGVPLPVHTRAPARFRVALSREGVALGQIAGSERGLDEGPAGIPSVIPGTETTLTAAMLQIRLLYAKLGDALVPAVLAAGLGGGTFRFDELLGLFQRIGPDGELALSLHQSNGNPPVVVVVWGSVELILAGQRLQIDSATDRVELSGAMLPFLGKFTRLCNFSAAALHLEMLRREVRGAYTSVWFGRPSFLFRRNNGEELREDRLSFGQKRLLSFLYYATLCDPIVADELVDGLHYDWIKECLEAVKGKQKFLASQNPLLVDHMGFKTRESVRSRFVQCTLEGDEMVWENFSEAQADDFFVAYRTGISGVSEVLRSKGLW